jgi:hypothetical protein
LPGWQDRQVALVRVRPLQHDLVVIQPSRAEPRDRVMAKLELPLQGGTSGYL